MLHAWQCTMQPNLHPASLRYLHVAVSDESSANLLPGHLARVQAWVKEHLSAGRAVLIHCHAGVSRSPTIVLALLLQLRGMSLIEAWTHVKGLRPKVNPNAGFCQQLCDVELALRGRQTAIVDPRKHEGLIPMVQGPTAAIQSYRNI